MDVRVLRSENLGFWRRTSVKSNNFYNSTLNFRNHFTLIYTPESLHFLTKQIFSIKFHEEPDPPYMPISLAQFSEFVKLLVL